MEAGGESVFSRHRAVSSELPARGNHVKGKGSKSKKAVMMRQGPSG